MPAVRTQHPVLRARTPFPSNIRDTPGHRFLMRRRTRGSLASSDGAPERKVNVSWGSCGAGGTWIRATFLSAFLFRCPQGAYPGCATKCRQSLCRTGYAANHASARGSWASSSHSCGMRSGTGAANRWVAASTSGAVVGQPAHMAMHCGCPSCPVRAADRRAGLLLPRHRAQRTQRRGRACTWKGMGQQPLSAEHPGRAAPFDKQPPWLPRGGRLRG